jgi:hypothetical protein
MMGIVELHRLGEEELGKALDDGLKYRGVGIH